MKTWLHFAVAVALVLGLAAPAAGQGTCGVPFTFQTGDSVTAATMNTIQTTLGQTNMITTCMDDYSSSAAIMRTATDPYASGTESLATSLAGELERLRYVQRHLHGFTYWYSHNEDVNFGHRTIRNHLTTLTSYKELIRSEAHLSSASTRFHLMSLGVTEYVAGAAHPESAMLLLHVNTSVRFMVGIGGDTHVGSTLAVHASGTAAFPALYRVGDTNTGLYWPAADQLAITVGGAAAATFTTGAAGPHAIGGATNADVGLLVTGTGAAGQAMGMQISSTTTPATTESSYGLNVTPTLTEFSSGLHPALAGINVEPTVTAGAGTLTTLAGLRTGALTAQTGTVNAAAIYVSAAPTGATNNYATWAGTGTVRIDGNLMLNGSNTISSVEPSQLMFGTVASGTGAGTFTEVMRISGTGTSLQLGGSAARSGTAGTFRLDIFDGTAPTGTLANGISLYSTAGELRVMDSGGVATLLSPHNKQGEWIFFSNNSRTGHVLQIEFERLMRALDRHFGGGYIYEYVEMN